MYFKYRQMSLWVLLTTTNRNGKGTSCDNVKAFQTPCLRTASYLQQYPGFSALKKIVHLLLWSHAVIFFLKTKGLAKAHTPIFKKETPTFKQNWMQKTQYILTANAESYNTWQPVKWFAGTSDQNRVTDLLPEVFTGSETLLSEFDAISRNLLYHC